MIRRTKLRRCQTFDSMTRQARSGFGLTHQRAKKILTSDTMMTKSSKPTALTNLHRTISLNITTAVASVVVMMVGVRASQRRFGFSWCAFVVILGQRSKVTMSIAVKCGRRKVMNKMIGNDMVLKLKVINRR